MPPFHHGASPWLCKQFSGMRKWLCLVQGGTNLTATQPEGARQLISNLQSRLQAVMPRFQELLNTPGAAEIRAELTKGLVERSLARAIKLVFNQDQAPEQPQQLGRRQQGRLPAGTAPSYQRL